MNAPRLTLLGNACFAGGLCRRSIRLPIAILSDEHSYRECIACKRDYLMMGETT